MHKPYSVNLPNFHFIDALEMLLTHFDLKKIPTYGCAFFFQQKYTCKEHQEKNEFWDKIFLEEVLSFQVIWIQGDQVLRFHCTQINGTFPDQKGTTISIHHFAVEVSSLVCTSTCLVIIDWGTSSDEEPIFI